MKKYQIPETRIEIVHAPNYLAARVGDEEFVLYTGE